METVPSKEGLLEALKDLGQTELYNQLLNTPSLFMIWKKRTEAQWKEELIALKGNAGGFSDIYNYLNPRSEGINYLSVASIVESATANFGENDPLQVQRNGIKF
jgi:hypothetical protein